MYMSFISQSVRCGTYAGCLIFNTANQHNQHHHQPNSFSINPNYMVLSFQVLIIEIKMFSGQVRAPLLHHCHFHVPRGVRMYGFVSWCRCFYLTFIQLFRKKVFTVISRKYWAHVIKFHIPKAQTTGEEEE